MSFLNPALALAGLACIALPILIHLLMRRRRRPIPWAAMRFLMEAYKRQKRRLTLEQLLLLAARCLPIALVALAIGRPVLGEAGLLGQGGGARTLYILFDDSLTSTANPPPGVGEPASDPLAEAKRRAAALLAQLDASRGDRAALITLAAPAQSIIVPASSDLDAVRRALTAIEPTGARADLHAGLERVRQARTAEDLDRPLVAIVSSMRAGAIDPSRPLPSLDARLATVLVVGEADAPLPNIAITSAEPLRRVTLAEDDEPAPITLRVTLERFGPAVSASAATSLTARVGGGVESRTIVPWSEGQRVASASIAVVAPPGVGSALLRGERAVPIDLRAATPGDALALDDARTVVALRQRSLRVGLHGESARFAGARSIDQLTPSDWLRLALSPETRGPADEDLAVIRTIDLDTPELVPARLDGLDALVLTRPDLIDAPAWARLADFVRAGRLVLVVPPPDLSTHAWGEPMADAFELPWQVQRQPVELDPPASPSLASEPPRLDLLRVLRGEIDALLAPVNVSRALAIGAPTGHALLALPDGRPLLLAASVRGERGEGSNLPPAAGEVEQESPRASGGLVLLATSLDLSWTDLPARPLMVPLVQELVRQGVSTSRPASEVVAGPINPPAGARELRDASGAVRWSAGEFAERSPRTLSALDDAGRTIALLAVHPDTNASDTSLVDPAAWSTWLTAVSGRAPERDAGASGGSGSLAEARDHAGESLALTLLLIAAGIAVFELALARFASHATIAREASA